MRQRKAFTMIEMLIVISVILVLMGLSVAAYINLTNSSAAKATRVHLQLCQSILAEYEQTVGFQKLGGDITDPTKPWLRTDLDFPYPGGFNLDSTIAASWPSAPIGFGTNVPADAQGSFTNFPYDRSDPNIRNAFYDTAAMMMYMCRAPQVHQIVGSVPPSLFLLGTDGQPVGMQVGSLVVEAPILLDGWSKPIIYVPAGGMYVKILVTRPSTFALALVRSSGTVVFNGGALGTAPPLGPNDRPFWASSGPDGNFITGDDNIYSFQQH